VHAHCTSAQGNSRAVWAAKACKRHSNSPSSQQQSHQLTVTAATHSHQLTVTAAHSHRNSQSQQLHSPSSSLLEIFAKAPRRSVCPLVLSRDPVAKSVDLRTCLLLSSTPALQHSSTRASYSCLLLSCSCLLLLCSCARVLAVQSLPLTVPESHNLTHESIYHT
jgi:hypothetical protein